MKKLFQATLENITRVRNQTERYGARERDKKREREKKKCEKERGRKKEALCSPNIFSSEGFHI